MNDFRNGVNANDPRMTSCRVVGAASLNERRAEGGEGRAPSRARALPSSTSRLGGGRHGEFIVTPDSIWASLFPSDVRRIGCQEALPTRRVYGIDKTLAAEIRIPGSRIRIYISRNRAEFESRHAHVRQVKRNRRDVFDDKARSRQWACSYVSFRLASEKSGHRHRRKFDARSIRVLARDRRGTPPLSR